MCVCVCVCVCECLCVFVSASASVITKMQATAFNCFHTMNLHFVELNRRSCAGQMTEAVMCPRNEDVKYVPLRFPER